MILNLIFPDQHPSSLLNPNTPEVDKITNWPIGAPIISVTNNVTTSQRGPLFSSPIPHHKHSRRGGSGIMRTGWVGPLSSIFLALIFFRVVGWVGFVLAEGGYSWGVSFALSARRWKNKRTSERWCPTRALAIVQGLYYYDRMCICCCSLISAFLDIATSRTAGMKRSVCYGTQRT
jgi:hypothetical protein